MARSNGWLRLYNRMIDSPEILELNDSEFRLIVSMWCLASLGGEGGIIRYSIKALRRRIMPDKTEEEILEMIEHLKELDLLIEEDGYFRIPRWEIHQYSYEEKEGNEETKKDYMRAYMREYRRRKKDVKLVESNVKVNVNPVKVNSKTNKVNCKVNSKINACSNNILDLDKDKELDKENINNNIHTSYDEQGSKKKSTKKYSDNAKVFLDLFRNYRENILKIPITKKDWHLKTLAIGEKLLKKYSLEEISKAIRDLGEKKDYKIIEPYHFEDFLPKWKAEKVMKEEENGKDSGNYEHDPEYERVKKYLPWLEGTEDIPVAVVPEFLQKYRKVKST